MPIGIGTGLALRNFPMGSASEPMNPPTILTAPEITNLAPTVGDVLSFTRGTYTNSPTSYTQAWLADGVALPGETAETLNVGSAYSSAIITVKEIAHNSVGGSPENESGPTAQVTQIPTWDTPASITSNGDINNPVVGDIFSANGSGCVGFPVPTLSYKWERNFGGSSPWEDILGATSIDYQSEPLDAGYVIRCVITGSNSIADVTSDSNETGIVT